jgi:hypothetical protein
MVIRRFIIKTPALTARDRPVRSQGANRHPADSAIVAVHLRPCEFPSDRRSMYLAARE